MSDVSEQKTILNLWLNAAYVFANRETCIAFANRETRVTQGASIPSLAYEAANAVAFMERRSDVKILGRDLGVAVGVAESAAKLVGHTDLSTPQAIAFVEKILLEKENSLKTFEIALRVSVSSLLEACMGAELLDMNAATVLLHNIERRLTCRRSELGLT